MQINPYIFFNGRCQEALDFYERAIGAKVVMKMTYADAPPGNECSPGSEKKIMHARLDIGNDVIMLSDAPADRYSPPAGFSISLSLQDPVEAEVVFKALSEGGKVVMPIGETFWAQRFGMLNDKFGIPWMVNCEKSA
jgi:PhnB protein